MTLYGLTDEQEKELREEIARLRNLINIAQRHKRVLEEQTAKFTSLHVPSHIILQISDLDDNIKMYQNSIEQHTKTIIDKLQNRIDGIDEVLDVLGNVVRNLEEANKYLLEVEKATMVADLSIDIMLNGKDVLRSSAQYIIYFEEQLYDRNIERSEIMKRIEKIKQL